jgi:hypothetical protein
MAQVSVNLADVVDIDDMVREILYCSDCELIKSKFVPDTYPEELKCTGVEDDSTDNEYLYW